MSIQQQSVQDGADVVLPQPDCVMQEGSQAVLTLDMCADVAVLLLRVWYLTLLANSTALYMLHT